MFSRPKAALIEVTLQISDQCPKCPHLTFVDFAEGSWGGEREGGVVYHENSATLKKKSPSGTEPNVLVVLTPPASDVY